jgi:putative ABC transport system permease protein
LFNKSRKDRELQDELESHIQMHMEDNLRSGMTPKEARRQAMIRLGGIESTKEAYREQRGLPVLETLWQDVRFGLRMLRKNPGFTAVILITLALGIGANTAIFSIVNGVLLKPLPYEQPSQLVQVWEASPEDKQNSVSPGAFLDWRDNNTVFDSLSLCQQMDVNLTSQGDPERVHGLGLSASGLRVLRAHPEFGRSFAPDEEQPGKDKVILLTHEFWRRRFGGATNVLNGTIQLDGENYTVIGVLPPRFLLWDTASFVIPTAIAPSDVNQRSAHWLTIIGRLKPGITVARAQSEMAALAARLRPLYPAFAKNWSVTIVPMREQITGDVRPTLLALAGAVGFVLLIACANVAGLLLAKAARRQGEMAIRVALGASRWRVIRQLLAESMVLSLIGATLGILLAFWGVAALGRQSGVILPRSQEIQIDPMVLGFAVIISIVAGTASGLVPALQMSRPDLSSSLKEGARGSDAGSRHRARAGFVIAEIAISVVLLTGAGLLLKSFARLVSVPPGINPRNALTMQITLPSRKYPDSERRAAFVAQAIERINSLPGVEAAGVVEMPPLAIWGESTSFTTVGRSDQPQDGSPTGYNFCTPGYFRAVGDPLLRGQLFDQTGRAGGARAVVISDAFAKKYFPHEEPLGKRIHLDVFTGKIDDGWEIVGVVGDIRRNLDGPLDPCVYRPQPFAWGSSWNVVIRTTTAPGAMTQAARKAIQELDPSLPVADIRTMDDVVSGSVGRERFTMFLFTAFAGAALLLAAIGLYGLIAFSVSQRTREFGIRTALGATRGNVIALILRQGLVLAGAGLALGVASACGLTRVLARMLFEVTPTDFPTFLSVCLLLIFVVVLGCWLPARRATRIDPVTALRHE